MSPFESPVGPDRQRAEARVGSVDASPPRFSRLAACRLTGLAPSQLARWERAAGEEVGLILPPSLTFADLLALAVLGDVSRRVGARLSLFTAGLAQVFEVLAGRTDLDRLDDYVALIGRDFARLAESQNDHVRCVGDAFIVVALHPILTALRDQAFA